MALRTSSLLLVPALLALASAPSQAQRINRATRAELDRAKAALARYSDPMVAVGEGYLSTVSCIDFKSGSGAASHHGAYKAGAMGVHFLNAGHIGPTLDPTKPQVLMYEPVGNRLELVGAEWFVPVAASKEAPTIFGRKLEGPMEGHAPIMPAGLHHWDLHVWLWKENPSGMFSPTNPAVKCPGGPLTHDPGAPKAVPAR